MSSYYNSKFSKGILYNDKKININWPQAFSNIKKRSQLKISMKILVLGSSGFLAKTLLI